MRELIETDDALLAARHWLAAAGVPSVSSSIKLVKWLLEEAEDERSENQWMREVLNACAGFLVTLRDDDHGYDFTVAHNEQIGRLCQRIYNVLHGMKDEADD